MFFEPLFKIQNIKEREKRRLQRGFHNLILVIMKLTDRNRLKLALVLETRGFFGKIDRLGIVRYRNVRRMPIELLGLTVGNDKIIFIFLLLLLGVITK